MKATPHPRKRVDQAIFWVGFPGASSSNRPWSCQRHKDPRAGACVSWTLVRRSARYLTSWLPAWPAVACALVHSQAVAHPVCLLDETNRVKKPGLKGSGRCCCPALAPKTWWFTAYLPRGSNKWWKCMMIYVFNSKISQYGVGWRWLKGRENPGAYSNRNFFQDFQGVRLHVVGRVPRSSMSMDAQGRLKILRFA